MKIVTLGGSFRTGSLNVQLNQIISDRLATLGHDVQVLRMSEVDAPSYNGDDESANGMAAGPARYKAALQGADAFVITSPEYNFSIPGGLKNLIDWVSRGQDQPFSRKPGFLASASPGLVGGNRGLWALRVPLEMLGAPLYPRMFSLAQASTALTPDGFADERTSKLLDGMLSEFLTFSAPRQG